MLLDARETSPMPFSEMCVARIQKLLVLTALFLAFAPAPISGSTVGDAN
jgi:hypothetical protein